MIDATSLNKIQQLFETAEAKIKKTERISSELVIPAINELRYCAFHLIKGQQSSDPVKSKEDIQKALRHCRRSCYDADEAALLFLLDKVKLFKEDYKLNSDIVVNFLPKYIEITEEFYNAIDFTAKRMEADTVSHTDDLAKEDFKEENYISCEDYVDKMSTIVKKLEVSRIPINEAVKKSEKNRRMVTLATIFALLTLLLSIIFGLPKFLNDISNTNQSKGSVPITVIDTLGVDKFIK